MTWEIVVGLIALISAGIAIGRIIYGLSVTLTKLNCSVEILNSTLASFASDNDRAHEEMSGGLAALWDKIAELENGRDGCPYAEKYKESADRKSGAKEISKELKE